MLFRRQRKVTLVAYRVSNFWFKAASGDIRCTSALSQSTLIWRLSPPVAPRPEAIRRSLSSQRPLRSTACDAHSNALTDHKTHGISDSETDRSAHSNADSETDTKTHFITDSFGDPDPDAGADNGDLSDIYGGRGDHIGQRGARRGGTGSAD